MGFNSWYRIASSSDGTRLSAVVYGGYIYTSEDGETKWSQENSAGSRIWQCIASSSDGKKLAVSGNNEKNIFL